MVLADPGLEKETARAIPAGTVKAIINMKAKMPMVLL